MDLLRQRQLDPATPGASAGLGASPWIAATGAALGVAGGLYQYFEGKKKAKEVDAMQRPTMAGARLQEFTGLENQYRDISQQGLGAAESNEFMKKAASANYANQLNAQSMGGGSLARYVNSLNNFNMINQIGALAGQNFSRRMQGLQGLTGLLNQKQNAINQDVMMTNQRIDRAGQAAAQLQQQGMANVVGGIGSGLSSLGQMYAYKSTTP